MENKAERLERQASGALICHEVSPRDGLQNETTLLDLTQKLQLLRLLVDANPHSIEVTSFVRPDRVPQLADAAELCQALQQQAWFDQARLGGMRFAGLVANRRGLERLIAAKLDSVTLLVSATDSHSQANVGMSRSEANAEVRKLMQEAKSAGLEIRAYVSMAFVCPFEGKVDPAPVLDLLSDFHDSGADVLIPADTLGAAEPTAVGDLLRSAMEVVPIEALGMHLHNTHGKALENSEVAWQLGIRRFDSAAGGIGGCPFAPGAAGNLNTKDLALWAAEYSHPHNLKIPQLQTASEFLSKQLEKPAI